MNYTLLIYHISQKSFYYFKCTVYFKNNVKISEYKQSIITEFFFILKMVNVLIYLNFI